MLRYLKIQNLAVIDQAELEVEGGFVCLTGESGAGKSVLIDALLLLGGGRASSDLVRTGCDKAIVEAEFELDEVSSELELLDGPQLFLRRELTKDGKSRAFVNGVMVPAGILGQYGELAFEIHGQHGQQRLLKASFHKGIFEEQMNLRDDANRFQSTYESFRSKLKEYWSLKDSESERLKEMDFLKMQLKEIDDVEPSEEDGDLDQRLKVARNGEMIRSGKDRLSDLLGRDLLNNLTEAEKLMESLREYLPELEPYMKEVVTLSTSLIDLRAEVQFMGGPDVDASLPQLEARETALNRLFLKYGRNLQEVMAERKRLAERLTYLRDTTTGLDEKWHKLEEQYVKLCAARKRLHKARDKAASGFVDNVCQNLDQLALKGAVFQLNNQWDEWPEALPKSRDVALPLAHIQFLFSPNPGETARPLARVASGGELSRVLLALIAAFKRVGARLLVFDEIDAGLGGETAHAVGRTLHQLGQNHQVLCVTHFAQVARYAGQQIKIAKNVEEGRTYTRLVSCDFEGRVSELARLMGGDSGAENLREHARSLLAQD